MINTNCINTIVSYRNIAKDNIIFQKLLLFETKATIINNLNLGIGQLLGHDPDDNLNLSTGQP